MKKEDVRRYHKYLRKGLSDSILDYQSSLIFEASLFLPIWDEQNYHIFLTIAGKREVDTGYFLTELTKRKKNIICSVSSFVDNTMQNYLVSEDTLTKISNRGVLEPVDGYPFPNDCIDVVFVPLLGFDRDGNRVGYGGGFYDKFLASCKPEVTKIGLSCFPPVDVIEEITDQDISLDYCITPNKTFKF